MARIMIVDDDVVSIMALEEALSDKKYELVGTAGTAAEAVQMEDRSWNRTWCSWIFTCREN